MPKKQHFWKKNMVANFGFNCKNGKVSPILRLHAITRVRITPKLNFCPKFCQKWSFKFNLIISNVWCQIVLVPNCLVPNCPVPNCPTTVKASFSPSLSRPQTQKPVFICFYISSSSFDIHCNLHHESASCLWKLARPASHWSHIYMQLTWDMENMIYIFTTCFALVYL